MLSKKGVSLVEMIIVLVIIGIITSFSVLGTSLYRASRLKADLAAVNKFEVAVRAYYLNTGSLPVRPISDTKYNLQFFLAYNFLTNADLQAQHESGQWELHGCRVEATGQFQAITESGRIGAPQVCLRHPQSSTIWSCSVETALDDEDYLSGRGRLASIFYTPPVVPYHDCDNKTLTAAPYMYRVF